MSQRLSPAATAKDLRAENSQGQYKKFEIRIIYGVFTPSSQRNGDSEPSNTGCFFLTSCQKQKILSEVQVASHLWSVLATVQHPISGESPCWFFYGGIYFFNVDFYIHVQPALYANESATLEVSSPYFEKTCLKIRSSATPCSDYGPYKIKVNLPAVPEFGDYGTLTLKLIAGKVDDPNRVSFTAKQSDPPPMDSFLEYSNQLFQNQELSDVTLKIRGKEFPAHKLLLSSFSPVFKTMFLSDFRESNSNVVEIKDFEFEVIREMLKFMYTHKLPQFRSPDCNIDTLSLYKAAHKYEIKYLLESCREELLSTINIQSALDVLLFADIYDDAVLKETVLDFICKNPPAVDDVSKYEEILRQRPGLMKDILTCKFKQN